MSNRHADAIGIPQAMALADDDPHDDDGDGYAGAGAASSIEEVRARLAARGLLATSPRVVVPKEPRPEGEAPVRTTFAPSAPDEAEGESHWADSEADEWDVEPGNEEVTVRCPQCRDVYFRPLESTRFACPSCDRSWRFAICEACDGLALTIERQESWRCGSCGHHTRSWWRTPTAPKAAIDIVARRKHQLVEEQRRLVREGMRKRRWKLIALAVWALVLAVGIVVWGRTSADGGATGTAVTCRHFDRLRSDLANGSLDRAELDKELDQLTRESEGAGDDIQKAVVDLHAANPGTSAFLIARTALADACDAAAG